MFFIKIFAKVRNKYEIKESEKGLGNQFPNKINSLFLLYPSLKKVIKINLWHF